MGWEFVRVVLKLVLVIGVVWGPVSDFATGSGEIYGLDVWLVRLGSATSTLFLRAIVAVLVLGIVDYIVTCRQLMTEMKMTRQEVSDEVRQSEGDQMLRSRRRQRAIELSRNRVLAKGRGAKAARMRTEAYRNGVPVHREVPLARALFRRCQVGQTIPSELFEAVAIVLAAVYRRRVLRKVA
ncbi:MAG: flagellar biosynthetic protein FlhB [Candidatus Poriferisodalaceae bacterium]|jgi:flagellar biosynthetic protein FlhB